MPQLTKQLLLEIADKDFLAEAGYILSQEGYHKKAVQVSLRT